MQIEVEQWPRREQRGAALCGELEVGSALELELRADDETHFFSAVPHSRPQRLPFKPDDNKTQPQRRKMAKLLLLALTALFASTSAYHIAAPSTAAVRSVGVSSSAAIASVG